MSHTDAELVQIVDAALADAARRSGDFLVCRPGCFQCCVGVFPISPLDAVRLRDGLRLLEETDGARAGRVRERVAESLERIGAAFPGDAATGVIDEASDAFEEYANDEVCPVLDPETGTCDLYAARPIPCRTFGPPVMNDEGGLAVCELCFHGATPEEIAACEMVPDPEGLEEKLLEEMGAAGMTIVAYALKAGTRD
jgi:Fe-S-cluster containining protein